MSEYVGGGEVWGRTSAVGEVGADPEGIREVRGSCDAVEWGTSPRASVEGPVGRENLPGCTRTC